MDTVFLVCTYLYYTHTFIHGHTHTHTHTHMHTHTSFRPLGVGTRGSRVQGVAESHNQTISGGRNWFSSPRRPANALKMNILLFHAFNHRLLYICCMNTHTHTYVCMNTHAFIYVLYRLQRARESMGNLK